MADETTASKEKVDASEEDSDIVTMPEFIEAELELEEESAAVLGGSNDKCCTYAEGYVKRQALYSCLTCCPDGRTHLTKCAGICLACSYHCHENHELIELYTKRNFRCDCPTLKIPGRKCSFRGDVELPVNEKNAYNQNFRGVYCTCHRPYPDPEDPIQDAMVQCVLCEDWYHMRHLDVVAPKEHECFEMVCGGCMGRYEFLQDYVGYAVKKVEGNENAEVNVTENDDKLKSDLDKSISDIMNMSQQEAEASTSNGGKKSEEAVLEKSDEPAPKKIKLDSECTRPSTASEYEKGATFWPDNWRDTLLCRCVKCLKLYDEWNVAFLLDPEDSAQHYEQKGLKSKESAYERGIQALSSMGRTHQIDAITEYNHMKDKLMEYLQTFAQTKKVVTQEDINRFFQEMKNERNANVGQPYFCR